ncbi:hypothetical protein AVEN_66041-1 [Araneus ventricosus]|uniref:Uncharacterized protein n=1 Tax=Araneus ventricosus TaxID=182803 RepID=A0A4Y2JY53_ARAVE|nr:hypothetical protein AVEN_66041-1 [Araneus ventricosus]
MSYHYNSEVNTWASNKNETGAVNTWASNKNERGADEANHVTTTRSAAHAEAGEEKNELAAGIETKMENYGNARFQRRHYSEADDDEVNHVTTKDNAADADGAVDIVEEETTKVKEAARVERKEIEFCEGIRTQRMHFPGTTTTTDFH